jgi:hypothetical protein
VSYRLDDWRCDTCGTIREAMTERGGPRSATLACDGCSSETTHERLLSAPAEYLGEKVRNHCAVRIKGGKYDTEGYQQGPSIPDIPGAAEHDAKLAGAMAQLPPSARPEDRRAVMREAAADGPTIGDYHDHMRKPDVAELARERRKIDVANAAKRKRAEAVAAGKTTVRNSPLPCDAKELHR